LFSQTEIYSKAELAITELDDPSLKGGYVSLLRKHGRKVLATISILVGITMVWQALHLHAILPAHFAVGHWNRVWMLYDLVYVPLWIATGVLYWRRSQYFAIVVPMLAAWLLANDVLITISSDSKGLAIDCVYFAIDVVLVVILLRLSIREIRNQGA